MKRMLLSLMAGMGFMAGCSLPVPDDTEEFDPPEDMPMLHGWSGDRKVRLGADSGTEIAALLWSRGARKLGVKLKRRQKVQVSSLPLALEKGGEPMVRNCPVFRLLFAREDGLVGWPVLRRYVWHLDYGNEHHELSRTLPPEVRGWRSAPMVPARHASLVLPGLGRCMLDTGAPHALYLPKHKWQQWVRENPQLRYDTLMGESPAAGGLFVIETTKVPRLRLGDVELRDVTVCESFCKFRHDPIIGGEALMQLEMWVDGPGRRVYYRPYDAKAVVAQSAEKNAFGAVLAR